MTEQLVDSGVKTFQVAKNWSGHDFGTFTGRFKYFFEVCSPEKSFHSTSTITRYNNDVKAILKEADAEG